LAFKSNEVGVVIFPLSNNTLDIGFYFVLFFGHEGKL